MPKVKINILPEVFNSIYYQHCLDDTNRYQILYGGSSSGKSKFIAQRNILDLLKGGRNFLCVRNTANTLRGSCFTEMVKVITEWNLKKLFPNIHESNMEIGCINKFTANFRGLDDVEKLKSFTPLHGVLTDIWVEEATEIVENDLEQLDKRLRGITEGKPKRITLSFNPIIKSHWIYKRFFKVWADNVTYRNADGVTILKTTYRDNRFLALDDIQALENTNDSYMRDVYRDGKWGILGGSIFPKVQVRNILDDPIFQTFDIYRHGLDFGYTNDPTAFNSIYYHRATRSLYIFKEWNAKGCTNDQIASVLCPFINGSGYVVCDSAEPKSITELNNHKLPARGAQKGKDSVLHGIQWLQQQNIIIDERCQNTINDFQGYHWKKDKNGESINVPSDAFSHHPDAVRYACEDLVFEAPEGIVTSAPSLVHSVQSSAEAGLTL